MWWRKQRSGGLRTKPVAQILALNLPFYWDLGLPVFATLPVVDGGHRQHAAWQRAAHHRQQSRRRERLHLHDQHARHRRRLRLLLYPVATYGERGAAIVYATDVAFACASWKVVGARTAPTYLYELERPVPNGPLAMYQSVHGYDFVNLFGTFSAWQVTPSAADLATSADIQAQWGALAHGRVPASWPAATGTDPSYRKLDDPPQAATGWRGGRCAQLDALGLLSAGS